MCGVDARPMPWISLTAFKSFSIVQSIKSFSNTNLVDARLICRNIIYTNVKAVLSQPNCNGLATIYLLTD